MAVFAAAYYVIGAMFIIGDAPAGWGLAFGVFGMLGISAPVILCGLHLALFGGNRPVWAHGAMVGALVAALAASIVAMLPWLLASPPHPEAGNVVFGAIAMAALFGWPLVRGLIHARLSRGD